MTVDVPYWLAGPPYHFGPVSFLLGIQEVLGKCLLDGRAAGAILGFRWAPGHRSRQDISRPLAGCSCLIFWPFPITSRKGDIFLQWFRGWAQTAKDQIPAVCDLGQVTQLFYALVSSLRRD